jgi:hypothetical protein|tara:strand:+ start:3843 stop:3962 length:120 start_codon:yes stop_codon:yes gene_type:complete
MVKEEKLTYKQIDEKLNLLIKKVKTLSRMKKIKIEKVLV